MTCKNYMKIASVSINKVLLAHCHTHSLPYCLWLLSCYNGQVHSLQWRPYSRQRLKYLLSRPSQKKFANPLDYNQGPEFKEA